MAVPKKKVAKKAAPKKAAVKKAVVPKTPRAPKSNVVVVDFSPDSKSLLQQLVDVIGANAGGAKVIQMPAPVDSGTTLAAGNSAAPAAPASPAPQPAAAGGGSRPGSGSRPGASTPAPAQPAAPAASASGGGNRPAAQPAAPVATGGGVSLTAVREMITAKGKANKSIQIIKLLEKYGVKKAQDLPVDQLDAFFDELNLI